MIVSSRQSQELEPTGLVWLYAWRAWKRKQRTLEANEARVVNQGFPGQKGTNTEQWKTGFEASKDAIVCSIMSFKGGNMKIVVEDKRAASAGSESSTKKVIGAKSCAAGKN